MRQLQDKEMKYHDKWWKDRENLRAKLVRSYMDIETSVESITQKETMEQELIAENT